MHLGLFLLPMEKTAHADSSGLLSVTRALVMYSGTCLEHQQNNGDKSTHNNQQLSGCGVNKHGTSVNN